MAADKATGVNVSPYVDYAPWLTGNVACVPDPRNLNIASPTGEGLTGPRSFSRWRRCVMVDHFRIT